MFSYDDFDAFGKQIAIAAQIKINSMWHYLFYNQICDENGH